MQNKAWELINYGDETDPECKPLCLKEALIKARNDKEVRLEHFLENYFPQQLDRSAASGSGDVAKGLDAKAKRAVETARKAEKEAVKALKAKGDQLNKLRSKGGPKGGVVGSGKRKGGKGIGKKLFSKVETVGADGKRKEICYAFNSEGCNSDNCGRAHVCRICLSDTHSMVNHKA